MSFRENLDIVPAGPPTLQPPASQGDIRKKQLPLDIPSLLQSLGPQQTAQV